jgi:iron(III) transport system substrate-binding protein
MVRKSSGEVLRPADRRARQPQDRRLVRRHRRPHLQAAEQDLTLAYNSAQARRAARLGTAPGAGRRPERPRPCTWARWAWPTTPRCWRARRSPRRKCWKDLLAPRVQGRGAELQPQQLGHGYTAIATFVQLFGEEAAFDYMKAAAPPHHRVHALGRRAGEERGARRDRRRPWASSRWPPARSSRACR